MAGTRKRDRSHEEHFAKLIRRLMETPAWRALSPTAQALYPWLLLEWHGTKFNNNGKIRLSSRQAAERMGCTKNTTAAAFKELQAKGFIVVTEGATLGVHGAAKSPSYEITDYPLPGAEKPTGRKLYMNWALGKDFPVRHTASNNPNGRNGKTKPCPKNEDAPVPIIGTKS